MVRVSMCAALSIEHLAMQTQFSSPIKVWPSGLNFSHNYSHLGSSVNRRELADTTAMQSYQVQQIPYDLL